MINAGVSAINISNSQILATGFLLNELNIQTSNFASQGSINLKQASPEQIAALTSAIAEGGLLKNEIGEFVSSIGGIENLQNIEEPATAARQFIIDSNFVDLSQSRFLLPDERDYVFSRSVRYGELDESLNSRGSIYQTDFFAAAEDVTDVGGLTGGQFLASLTLGNALYDLDALEDLQSIGSGLYSDFNQPVYEALYYGDDSYYLANWSKLGPDNKR